MLKRPATYCAVEIDVWLGDVGAINHDIVGDAIRSRKIIGAQGANASDL
jgi:hypothetical protein